MGIHINSIPDLKVSATGIVIKKDGTIKRDVEPENQTKGESKWHLSSRPQSGTPPVMQS